MGVVTTNQSWVEKRAADTPLPHHNQCRPGQAYRGCRCVGPVETKLDHLGA